VFERDWAGVAKRRENCSSTRIPLRPISSNSSEPQFLDNPRVPHPLNASRMRLEVAGRGASQPSEPALHAAERTLLLPRGGRFDAAAVAERTLGVGETRARVMEARGGTPLHAGPPFCLRTADKARAARYR
jgi:hypothetical protein